MHGAAGPTLIFRWYDASVLNHATMRGADRSGLTRFQHLPVPQVEAAFDAILDAHLAVGAAGLVAVDLYDGCVPEAVGQVRGCSEFHRRAVGRLSAWPSTRSSTCAIAQAERLGAV
ncbi:hypothetical protein [Micromonospora hortensis]|uniref:hypothetical protein n=1 Tax=Micromonospora hortensis TaxID=2911209 RepID=UPI001EE7D694|nr:hypothetical protein [Micromonospora hortensis]MCG5449131.1 hypothetical protein [Micromonospora hortensis]